VPSQALAGGLDICLEIGGRGGFVHAVVEIEDMAPATSGPKAVPDSGADLLGGAVTEGFHGHIALENQMGPFGPGLGQVVTGPQGYNRGAGIAQFVEVGAFLDEQDGGFAGVRAAGLGEDVHMPALSPRIVFGLAEFAGPTVKKLPGIATLCQQGVDEADSGVAEAFHQAVKNQRVLAGEGAGGIEILAGADAITGHREGCPGEDQHRKRPSSISRTRASRPVMWA